MRPGRGTPGQACKFTNLVPNQPRPAKYVHVDLEVRYSAAPNIQAVDDAAFWIGQPNNITLFVFRAGCPKEDLASQ